MLGRDKTLRKLYMANVSLARLDEKPRAPLPVLNASPGAGKSAVLEVFAQPDKLLANIASIAGNMQAVIAEEEASDSSQDANKSLSPGEKEKHNSERREQLNRLARTPVENFITLAVTFNSETSVEQ